jgi:glycosyltransferase involved in cell wall biosynthesis
METTNLPLVSVLMTSYNREKYIADAIESILESTYTNFELIIVDDGSKDKTVEIAKTYQAKDNRVTVYVNEKNLGDYNNRNKAASYAKGKYIKYLDSDDMIYKYGLAIMVEGMEKFPKAAIGLTSRNIAPLKPFPILHSPLEAFNKHYFEYGLLNMGPSSVIINRIAFVDIGMFSGKRHIGDVECWAKMAMNSCVIELQPSLIFWRQHEEQEIKTEKKNGHFNEDFFITEHSVAIDILNEKKCPLSSKQKKYLIRKKNKVAIRQIIKHFLKTLEFKKCIRIYKHLDLKLKNVF